MKPGLPILSLLILAFSGCAPGIERTRYSIPTNAGQECRLLFLDTIDEEVRKNMASVGEIEVFSKRFPKERCEDQVLEIIHREGCMVEADVAVITEIERPDCAGHFRILAEYLKSTGTRKMQFASIKYSKENIRKRVTRDKVFPFSILGVFIVSLFTLTYFSERYQ